MQLQRLRCITVAWEHDTIVQVECRSGCCLTAQISHHTNYDYGVYLK